MVTEMMNAQQLHVDHKLWENELNFFVDELKIFEKRLSELVSKNNDREMLAKLEHFQNQFIRQKEVLDHISHDIKVHEQQIAGALLNNKDISPDLKEAHGKVAEQMADYRRIYGDLKYEFQHFLLKWL